MVKPTPSHVRRHPAAALRLVLAAIAVALLACAGATGAQAQGESPVNITFTTLSLGDSLSDIAYSDRNGTHPVRVLNGARGHLYRYSGSPQLTFFHDSTATRAATNTAASAAADDSTTPNATNATNAANTTNTAAEAAHAQLRTALASVDLGGKSGHWLLLFFPAQGGDAPTPYRIYPVEDSTERFPANAWRVFNFNAAPVALQVGEDKPLLIPVGGHHTFVSPARENRGEKVQIAMQKPDGWQIVYRSLWGRRNGSRSLIFLMPTNKGDTISARQFSETVKN